MMVVLHQLTWSHQPLTQVHIWGSQQIPLWGGILYWRSTKVYLMFLWAYCIHNVSMAFVQCTGWSPRLWSCRTEVIMPCSFAHSQWYNTDMSRAFYTVFWKNRFGMSCIHVAEFSSLKWHTLGTFEKSKNDHFDGEHHKIKERGVALSSLYPLLKEMIQEALKHLFILKEFNQLLLWLPCSCLQVSEAS